MLGLVDRSDENVIGTTESLVKARTVHRLLAGQRGDAANAKVCWCSDGCSREQIGSSSHGAEGLQSPSVLHPARSEAREVRILR